MAEEKNKKTIILQSKNHAQVEEYSEAVLNVR